MTHAGSTLPPHNLGIAKEFVQAALGQCDLWIWGATALEYILRKCIHSPKLCLDLRSKPLRVCHDDDLVQTDMILTLL